ncbi:MAG: hypothetical protein ACT4OX_04105 [Actinomycetota bacterium]
MAAYRLGLECEGFSVHGRRHAYDPDRARLRALAAAGWRVFPVTWEATKQPDVLGGLVRAALSQRAP